MTPEEHGGAVTSNRDTLAAVLVEALEWDFPGEQDEPPPIFGCDTRVPSGLQVCEDIADALMPTVEAMLAQARAEVVAAVGAVATELERHAGGFGSAYQHGRSDASSDAAHVLRAALATVSGTDHDTTFDTVRSAE